MTHSFFFSFLVWNLFLAYVPYGITLYLQTNPKKKYLSYTWVPILAVWLLFLPNAPYITTDLQHLRHSSGHWVYFDVLLVLSYALYALWIFYLTLRDMQRLFFERWLGKYAQYLVFILCFLTAFGIYLGRVLRWNSWDILSNPSGLIGDVWSLLRHPFDHGGAWLFILGYSLFLSLVYFSLYQDHKKMVSKTC